MTDVRQLLIDANPVQRAEVPDALRAQILADAARLQPARRRRRRWHWPIPTLLVTLVAAGGVATAGALLISSATKEQSTAMTRDAPLTGDQGRPTGYGEEVSAAASRFMAQTPYPPGMVDDFDWMSYGGSGPGEMSGSVRMLVEHRAACLWRAYWVYATEHRQIEGAADAARILDDTVTWPSMRGNGGDEQAIRRRVAAAAAAGDVARVKELSSSDCGPLIGRTPRRMKAP